MNTLQLFAVGNRITWYRYNFEGIITEHGGGLIISITLQDDEDLPLLHVLKDGSTKVTIFSSRDCEIEKEWIDDLG